MTAKLGKVCNPLLPTAQQILAYLDVPDKERWYANRGKLVRTLEERLSQTFGFNHDVVITAATGTAALEASILSTVGRATPERPMALMPSYTFAATAHAAERCGFQPYFADVGPKTWSLDPDTLTRHPALSKVGVIMVVAPYGRLPDMRALERLQEETGIQVVVDAAAAFEGVCASPSAISKTIPLCLSFHATKTFSTGEGGAVLWDNQAGREGVAQASNFGFLNSRECRGPGINGKLSEYHAAVGHAMLDMLEARTAAYHDVSANYRKVFSEQSVAGDLWVSPDVSSAYALIEAYTEQDGCLMQDALQTGSIGWRHWYEGGLHAMSHFQDCPRDALPVTTRLGQTLIGLPMAPDLGVDEIGPICAALGSTMGGQQNLVTRNASKAS